VQHVEIRPGCSADLSIDAHVRQEETLARAVVAEDFATRPAVVLPQCQREPGFAVVALLGATVTCPCFPAALHFDTSLAHPDSLVVPRKFHPMRRAIVTEGFSARPAVVLAYEHCEFLSACVAALAVLPLDLLLLGHWRKS